MNILSLFVYIYFHFSWWCKYLGVGLLAHEYIPFKETAKHFSKVVVQLHVPASGISESQLLHIFNSIWIVSHFKFSRSSGYEMISNHVFNLYSLMIIDFEPLSMCLLAIPISHRTTVQAHLHF